MYLHCKKLQYIVLLLNYLTGDHDYLAGPYNVTIPTGQTGVSFDISITDDNILEINESFNLVITPESLPFLVSRGIPGMVLVTIMNNDGKQLAKSSITVRISESIS